MRAHRSFTLIELLIVIAIISVLATLVGAAMVRARVNTQIAAARSDMKAIQGGLSMYYADYRRHPKAAPREGSKDQVLADDAPVLFAALMNQPAQGGGRGAPYVKGRDTGLGIVLDRGVLAAPTMGQDPDGWRTLEGDEMTDRHYDAFQDAHGPQSAEPLVFLDPWGNPYHYREWDTVGRSVKQGIHEDPPRRTGLASLPHLSGDTPLDDVPDRPHDPYGIDLWSNGPNGINEYGAPGSDDVVVGRITR